jgi:DNA-directed RNA polymerase specialized sigma24 family protein
MRASEEPDLAERVALVARARRQALLRAHRHRLRQEDLEDCLSQATVELVAHARAGGAFANTAHVARALELRFLSRIQDRRRAVSGRSPAQAAMEGALAMGSLGEGVYAQVPHPGPGPAELVQLRFELSRVPELARELTADQRLVLASQVSLGASRAEFCAAYGWSHEKYRKVAQRARARLRRLSREEGVPLAAGRSEEETGTHL